MYFSKLLNIFVQTAKYICPNSDQLLHINQLLASSSNYFHSLLLSVFRKEPTIEQDSP